MQNIEGHVGDLKRKLDQWGKKLEELAAEAGGVGADAKLDYRNRIDDLKARHKSALAKLAELEGAGSERWEALKTGVDGAWDELETAFRKLVN